MELNSKGLYQSSGKEKESCCFVFPPSTKRDIRRFHVVVGQRRLRNVQKSVMHVQSCLVLAIETYWLLSFSLPSASPSPSLLSLVKLPMLNLSQFYVKTNGDFTGQRRPTSSPGRFSLALGAGPKPGKSALGTRLRGGSLGDSTLAPEIVLEIPKKNKK